MVCIYILVLSILLMIVILTFFNAKEGFLAKHNYAGITVNSNPPWTVNGETKEVITTIITKILEGVNARIGTQFIIYAYDQIKIDNLTNGTSLIVADFFVQDMQLQVVKRMLVEFEIIRHTGSVNVRYLNLSNALQQEPRHPNHVTVDNPLILTDSAYGRSVGIEGLNITKMEWSAFEGLPSNYKTLESAEGLTKWFLPLGIETAYYNHQATFPCRQQSERWDTHGVNIVEEPSLQCSGINNTKMLKYPISYDNPSINRGTELNNGDQYWIGNAIMNTSGRGRNVSGQ